MEKSDMADGLFYNDLREPFVIADLTAISPLATAVALYTPSAFPVLGGQYFSRPGKALKIQLFGRMTSALTPGNVSWAVFYGTGASANGVNLGASAAKAWTASTSRSQRWEPTNPAPPVTRILLVLLTNHLG